MPIQIAACGTSNRDGFYSGPTINIMPRMDGETDILISTRRNGTTRRSPSDIAEIERLQSIIESIKNDPAVGIAALIRSIEQVFLNPDEYNDDSIISEDKRTSLREGIAGYRAEEFQRINRSANVPSRGRK